MSYPQYCFMLTLTSSFLIVGEGFALGFTSMRRENTQLSPASSLWQCVRKSLGYGFRLDSGATQHSLAVCLCTIMWGSVFWPMKWRGWARSGCFQGCCTQLFRNCCMWVSHLGFLIGCLGKLIYIKTWVLWTEHLVAKKILKATWPFSGTSISNICTSLSNTCECMLTVYSRSWFPCLPWRFGSGCLFPVVLCVLGPHTEGRKALILEKNGYSTSQFYTILFFVCFFIFFIF